MKTSGFTLVEIILVVIIIGILVAVAVPRFVDLQRDSKIAATKAVLGAVRTAIENFRLDSIAKTGVDRYPTYDEVYESPGHLSGIMAGGDIPDNQFSTNTKFGQDKDMVYNATGVSKGTLIGFYRQGWCYRQTESSPGAGDAGQFWANTSTTGVNENQF